MCLKKQKMGNFLHKKQHSVKFSLTTIIYVISLSRYIVYKGAYVYKEEVVYNFDADRLIKDG